CHRCSVFYTCIRHCSSPAPFLPYTTLFRSRWSIAGSAPIAMEVSRHVRLVLRNHRRPPFRKCKGSVVLLDPNDDDSHHSRWCGRSEEHTSELQSHLNLVCSLLLEKKKTFGF